MFQNTSWCSDDVFNLIFNTFLNFWIFQNPNMAALQEIESLKKF